jgi:hypothetical protein
VVHRPVEVKHESNTRDARQPNALAAIASREHASGACSRPASAPSAAGDGLGGRDAKASDHQTNWSMTL